MGAAGREHATHKMTGGVIDQLDYRSAALSMFGAQVNSGRKSSPVYGMGTGYHNPHVFVSQDHEKCNYGRLGPGPAHYTSEDSWTKDKSGKKTESTKVSCSSTKFGNASRFYTVRDPRMPSGTP